MITVLGATGHTGGRVAAILLSHGVKVRAVGRDKKKLQRLVEQGAEALSGDASDQAFLTRAFAGVGAAYTLIPPDLTARDVGAYQGRVGEATIRALRASGVKRVVFLSSQGADLASGTGPIAGLHAQEERLRELGIDVLLLRPAFFFENLYASLPLIREKGINGSALAPDTRLAMIATRDIGEAAATALAASDFKGVSVRDLLGPRDLTMNEVTRILGARLGKPDLNYVQFPYADYAAALEHAGLSKDVSGSFAEMARAFNEGLIKLANRSPASTTPTTFESFADEFARAYESL